ncbi:MAG TPA: BT_3928 family protein [Chitinophagaceae bacterium]
MRATVNIVRVIVGVLFIVSGLVKANDPLGLAYKMEEFFEIWNADLATSSFFIKNALISLFTFLHDYSLALSVIMITLEIIAGVALLVGWQRKLVLNGLFLLITFFTFLTAYAYLSGKFKNCGCFGDCLPITPFASFLKDVILFLLILFLLAGWRYIDPVFTKRGQLATVLTSLVLIVGLQWYALNYLPPVDCLPFKEGNNIAEQMKIPANAVPDSFAMKFIYEKEGKNYEFSMDELPADLASYKFIDRTQKLIRKGNAEPPIKGFSLNGVSGSDSTGAVLAEQQALLVFVEHFRKIPPNWVDDLKTLHSKTKELNTPVYVITPDAAKGRALLAKNGLQDVPVFSCDNTAVRTAARTNPTFMLIHKGTIKEKSSYRQVDDIAGQL